MLLPILDQRQKQELRTLEYWKPPKALRHIRSKSSTAFLSSSKGNRRTTFSASNDIEEGFEKDIGKSTTVGTMPHGFKNEYPMGPPPQYKLDDENTATSRRRFDPRTWGRKIWFIAIAVLAVIIIAIVAAVVEVEKKNKYPNYSELSYSISETCMSSFFPPRPSANGEQIQEPVSSTSLIILQATILQQALSIMLIQQKRLH